MEFFLVTLLNSLSYGLLLFMLSSGLTLIFSMMGVLNFAHASFYMLGAYFAYQTGLYVGFWPALFIAPLIVGALGAATERFGLRTVHKFGHVAELLFTFGLAYVIEEVVHLIWVAPRWITAYPATGFHAVHALHHAISGLSRLHMLVDRLACCCFGYLVLDRTRIGLVILLPSHIRHVNRSATMFRVVHAGFCGRCALAGLAGVTRQAFLHQPGWPLHGSIGFVACIRWHGSLRRLPSRSLIIALAKTFACP
jgi:branched-chain amino acid transport system permease protein